MKSILKILNTELELGSLDPQKYIHNTFLLHLQQQQKD